MRRSGAALWRAAAATLMWAVFALTEALLPVSPPQSPAVVELSVLPRCSTSHGACETAAACAGKCTARSSVLFQAGSRFLHNDIGASGSQPELALQSSVKEIGLTAEEPGFRTMRWIEKAGNSGKRATSSAGVAAGTGDANTTRICGTREDGTATGVDWVGGASEASPGTACVFGIDLRDEGGHCIMETQFGALGWCYTRKDKSEWGSCNEHCRLAGLDGVLEAKADAVAAKLNEVSDRLDRLKGCGKNLTNATDGEEHPGPEVSALARHSRSEEKKSIASLLVDRLRKVVAAHQRPRTASKKKEGGAGPGEALTLPFRSIA